MAVGTLYGVVATAALTGGVDNWQDKGKIDGRVKIMSDAYTTTGANEDATSTIAMGFTLPQGARIIDVIVSLSKALTSSVTLDVGDSNDPNRYIDSLACSAAVVKHADLEPGIDYVVGTNDGDDQLLITIADANNAVTAAVIKAMVLYTQD